MNLHLSPAMPAKYRPKSLKPETEKQKNKYSNIHIKKSLKIGGLFILLLLAIGYFKNKATEKQYISDKPRLLVDMQDAQKSGDYKKVVTLGAPYSTVLDYEFHRIYDDAKVKLNDLEKSKDDETRKVTASKETKSESTPALTQPNSLSDSTGKITNSTSTNTQIQTTFANDLKKDSTTAKYLNKPKWKPSNWIFSGIGKPVQFETQDEVENYVIGLYQEDSTSLDPNTLKPTKVSYYTSLGPKNTSYSWTYHAGDYNHFSFIQYFNREGYRVRQGKNGIWLYSENGHGDDEYVINEKGLKSIKAYSTFEGDKQSIKGKGGNSIIDTAEKAQKETHAAKIF